ncbi:MAG: hypothetical protein A2666_04065 [Parcubacteria group bacterium RIFCSPHIGHO2_01_FULL_47_10b]|nr:MAG: hypothetical protein A2666_04065 [Parcubacteria group bacterium RIFCSPHIGHO2_01_FULL_47_10b]
MRNIINISLPRAMAKQVNEAVKEGGFASKSEFFRYLVRLWDEEKLYRDVMEGERDIAAGRYREVSSPEELLVHDED